MRTKYQLNHVGTEDICKIEFTLAEFNQQKTPKGMFTFPFVMQVPSWVPASMIHLDKDGQSAIKYEIRVFYGPSESLMAIQRLLIFSPQLPIQKPIECYINSEVKTIKSKMGLEKPQLCRSIFRFPKNQFIPGELAHMTVECDNSMCNTAVRNIKVKLYRKFLAGNRKQGEGISVIRRMEMLGEKEFDGLPAKQKIIKQCQFAIPKLEKSVGSGEHTLARFLTRTCFGSSICIQYFIVVQIKHEVAIHSGTGQQVGLPIQILAPEFDVENEPLKPRGFWKPILFDTIQLQLPEVPEEINGYLSYYKQVTEPCERAWQGEGSKPIYLTSEDMEAEKKVFSECKKDLPVIIDKKGEQLPDDAFILAEADYVKRSIASSIS